MGTGLLSGAPRLLRRAIAAGANRFRHRSSWISLALAVGFSLVYLSGLSAVPFHPDESTWLVMSRDFEVLFVRRDLAAFTWHPALPIEWTEEYRLLNAPVPKYLMGLSRWLAGYPEAQLNGDWDWSESWEANVAEGHLPAPGLLLAGRWPGALLAGLTPLLLFWIGREVSHTRIALIGALLLGLNALALLHGRRAMAEGVALFFNTLAIWSCARLMRITSSPWRLSVLTGLAFGLSVASKQTGVLVLPVGWLACAWGRAWRTALLGIIGLTLVTALTFFALNPVLYARPLVVAQAMLTARAEVTQQVVETTRAYYPGVVLGGFVDRVRTLLLEVFLRPPAIADVPNYTLELAQATEAYLATPWHTLLRGPLAGALMAGLAAAGGVGLSLRFIRRQAQPGDIFLAVWLGSAVSLNLFFFPLDWQRHYLPLVPPVCLLVAHGLVMFTQLPRRAETV